VLNKGLNFLLLFGQHDPRVAEIEHFIYTCVRRCPQRVGGG
jgi:hypothetical protein